MTTNSAHHEQQPPAQEVDSLAAQLRRKNVQPIHSADDLACDGIFDDDEELAEFLAYTYAARRAELG